MILNTVVDATGGQLIPIPGARPDRKYEIELTIPGDGPLSNVEVFLFVDGSAAKSSTSRLDGAAQGSSPTIDNNNYAAGLYLGWAIYQAGLHSVGTLFPLLNGFAKFLMWAHTPGGAAKLEARGIWGDGASAWSTIGIKFGWGCNHVGIRVTEYTP